MITCKFENNREASLRHVVVDALIIKDNKILLTKRAKHLREGEKWCLPGGFLDRDETTVEAIMREVQEEIGYTCEVKDLFTVLDKPHRKGDDRQNIAFIFLVNLIAKVGEIDVTEVNDMQWFALDKLPPQATLAFDHYEIIWNYIDQHEEVLES